MVRNKIILFLLVSPHLFLLSKDNKIQKQVQKTTPQSTLYANCSSSTSQAILDIGKVSTVLLGGGDMWWDLSNKHYEVPKGSGKHSVFNGGLWIGAVDENEILKVAVVTYRQNGSDFWPGPINNQRLLEEPNTGEIIENPEYGTTSAEFCSFYDRHFEVNRNEVLEFINYNNSSNPDIEYPNYSIPQSILEYPGNRLYDNSENTFTGEDEQVETEPYYDLESLAPFRDVDGDNFYNPYAGDYPELNLDNSIDCGSGAYIRGDRCYFNIINDKGNNHTVSGSEEALGIEIHVQSFAFVPTEIDAVDYATFYNYKMINRSHQALNEMYFGIRVDSDLGNYQDDMIGCNVARGLGYTYNGDAVDETAAGYGENPPAIGLDFVQGPLADENDGVDNNRDGIIDEPGERISMSNFMYHYNTSGVYGNPQVASDYYNYLRSIWLNGSEVTLCGDGIDPSNPVTTFMFADDIEAPCLSGEEGAGNVPGNRRYVQSVGAFTMEPGALQNISTAMIWSRTNTDGPWGSVEKLKVDDDFIQDMFDNCFEVPCESPNAAIATYELVEDNYALGMNYKMQFVYPYSSLIHEGIEMLWEFGDGESSEVLMPLHTYETPGDYSVYLKVTTDCGEHAVVMDVHVPNLMNLNSVVSVPIMRMEGFGNGGRTLELTEDSHNQIRDDFGVKNITYKRNYGPFLIHINDVNNVDEGDYELKVLDVNSMSFTWQIRQLSTGESITTLSELGLNEVFEFENWGFDIQINQVNNVGDLEAHRNGFNSASWSSSNWLGFVKDNDDFSYEETIGWNDPVYVISPYNWIRTGTSEVDVRMSSSFGLGDFDTEEVFEKVLEGTWAPYRLVASEQDNFTHALAWDQFQSLSSLKRTPSVDVVFTDNQTLWTRVPVIETGDGVGRLNLKSNASVDKNGSPDGTGNGFSWFPGYAIDLEKGIRLNMMFGEASDLPNHNGNDMQWNPTFTDTVGAFQNNFDDVEVIFGGKHYIYVMKSKYEGVDETMHPFYTMLTNMSSTSSKRKVFQDVSWVSIPMLQENATLLSDEVHVKLRISRPYEEYDFDDSGLNNTVYQNDGLPLYQFSIDGDYSDLSVQNEILDEDAKLVKLINLLGQEVLLQNLIEGTPYIEMYDNGVCLKKLK